MSEVDRLSNSGLYPALPIADRRSSKDEREDRTRHDRVPPDKPSAADPHDPNGGPRPPKSLIDEYA
jgi:hypothetical protein